MHSLLFYKEKKHYLIQNKPQILDSYILWNIPIFIFLDYGIKQNKYTIFLY